MTKRYCVKRLQKCIIVLVLLLFAFSGFSCAKQKPVIDETVVNETTNDKVEEATVTKELNEENKIDTEEGAEDEVIYIDDSYSTELTEIRTNILERTTRPTEFSVGSSYDEIIYGRRMPQRKGKGCGNYKTA